MAYGDMRRSNSAILITERRWPLGIRAYNQKETSLTLISVLYELFMAVQMPILSRFGITHTIPIRQEIFLPVRSMILAVWDRWMGG